MGQGVRKNPQSAGTGERRPHRSSSLSHAIIMTDALNIHDGTLKLKKEFLQRRAA